MFEVLLFLLSVLGGVLGVLFYRAMRDQSAKLKASRRPFEGMDMFDASSVSKETKTR